MAQSLDWDVESRIQKKESQIEVFTNKNQRQIAKTFLTDADFPTTI